MKIVLGDLDLQHGAYGTRMTGDYAMVRIKLPAGERFIQTNLEKLAQLSESLLNWKCTCFNHEKTSNCIGWFLEDVSEIMRGLSRSWINFT